MPERCWEKVKWFKPSEFDSKDEPGSGGRKMDLEFVYLLDSIRTFVGKPLRINSGYRSPAHNAKVGGKPNSAHMRGVAADIATPDWETAYRVVNIAMQLGVKRIGIQLQGTYVHLDIDKGLPTPRIWFYP